MQQPIFLKYVALRYFQRLRAADPEGELGEWHDPEPILIQGHCWRLEEKFPIASMVTTMRLKMAPVSRLYPCTDLARAHVLAA